MMRAELFNLYLFALSLWRVGWITGLWPTVLATLILAKWPGLLFWFVKTCETFSRNQGMDSAEHETMGLEVAA
ncbi:MAG: hypothetical protein JO356_02765 [Acidobacteria bacterium]|nr:hypothetical protein [Acidobacteriota bacterium]